MKCEYCHKKAIIRIYVEDGMDGLNKVPVCKYHLMNEPKDGDK